MTSLDFIRAEVGRVCSALPTGATEDLPAFVESIRNTQLPFLPCSAGPPDGLYRHCFALLYALGMHSIPLGVALAMHLYMLCAVATFPLTDDRLRARRRAFLDLVARDRLIVANAGSSSFDGGAAAEGSSTVAVRTAAGFVVSGHKTFVSLATVADLLIFTAESKDSGSMSFYTTLRNNPSVQIRQSPFGDAMDASGTRTVTFGELLVSEENVVTGCGSADFSGAHGFQRAWFQALIPAVYLGAAEAALSAARDYVRRTPCPDGSVMGELDGLTVEFGRQVLALRALHAIAHSLGDAVAECCDRDRDPSGLESLSDLAATFKYVAMRQVQHVLERSRVCVGTQAMHRDHLLFRLTQQVPHGVLHPETEAVVERRVGRVYLEARHSTSIG